jgi:RND family efflux transporter MFP subunit
MRLSMITCVAFLAAVFPALLQAQGRPAGVLTEIVEMREMTETVTVFGQIVAVRESAVATRVDGIINEVAVQVGTVVEKGDVLAVMDAARLEIELASAGAQLAIANAGLEVSQAQASRAEAAFRRARELTANASISGAQFEDRATALAEANGGLAQARAQIAAAANAIDLAQYNLDNATVRAPFDGIVLDVATQVGQFASSGSEVATLLDISSMEIEANVPSRYIQGLEQGTLVQGRNDAGTALAMTLRVILPTEFSETRTRPARFTLMEIDPYFAIGQPVTLAIPIGASRDVLVVPKDALVQASGGWTAYVNDDGKASPRTVTIGAALGDAFEVLTGLQAGDEVVVRGNERLRPGQEIAPIGASAPPSGDEARPSPEAASPPLAEGGGSDGERG